MTLSGRKNLHIIIAPDGITGHSHRYGLQPQHGLWASDIRYQSSGYRPQTSAWPSLVTQATDFDTYNDNMGAWQQLGPRHQYGLRWQLRSLTSRRPPVAAWPVAIDMASGCSTDHGPLHGPQG